MNLKFLKLFFIRYVTGNELLVSGKHLFSHFNDCKDISTYLCPEVINSIITLDVIKVNYKLSL